MDETTKDVVPAEGGGQEKPKPDTSPKDAGQGSPGGKSQLETVLTQINELTGQVRALQSDKDKGVARVSREVKDLSKQLESYYQRREAGLSHEQALREEVLDEIVAERSGTPKDAPVPPEEGKATQPAVASEDYLSPILRMAGLTAEDSDVIELLRRERDPIKRMNAIGELAESRKQALETLPNQAAVMSAGGGQAVESDTLDSITKELQAELLKRATPEQRERVRVLSKKQKELLPKE